MKLHGVIFQRSNKTEKVESFLLLVLVGEVAGMWQELVRPVKRTLKIWSRGMILGAILVILATAVLPIWLNKEQAKQRLAELKRSQITFSDLLKVEADKPVEITEATYFTIQIPKIEAYSKVIVNVDPGDKREYVEALSQGIAHAAGTYLPGMGGAVTLFSHSTDISANVALYNAVFYRLDELKAGDEVVLWFLGERRVYIVDSVKVIGAKDVSIFEADKTKERLYLMTCTPRGTTKNRLVVEASMLDS